MSRTFRKPSAVSPRNARIARNIAAVRTIYLEFHRPTTNVTGWNAMGHFVCDVNTPDEAYTAGAVFIRHVDITTYAAVETSLFPGFGTDRLYFFQRNVSGGGERWLPWPKEYSITWRPSKP